MLLITILIFCLQSLLMTPHLFVIIVGILAIILALGLSVLKSQKSHIVIPIQFEQPSRPLKAFVLGATGTAGTAIVKALLSHPDFDQVTVIGRSYLQRQSILNNPNSTKLYQRLINFEEPVTYSRVFHGYDVGFCALGTASSAGLSTEEYFQINRDYVVDVAEAAADAGCRHFHFISTSAAAKNSIFYWARAKAQVEGKLLQMGFERLSIYRPHKIIKDLAENLTGETWAGVHFYKTVDPYEFMSIDSLVLGKVIVHNTFRVTEEKNEILENADIKRFGGEIKYA